MGLPGRRPILSTSLMGVRPGGDLRSRVAALSCFSQEDPEAQGGGPLARGCAACLGGIAGDSTELSGVSFQDSTHSPVILLKTRWGHFPSQGRAWRNGLVEAKMRSMIPDVVTTIARLSQSELGTHQGPFKRAYPKIMLPYNLPSKAGYS